MDDSPKNNVDKLKAFWEQNDASGLTITTAAYFHNRFILSLGDFILVCDGVSEFNSTVHSLPGELLEQSIDWYAGRARLQIATRNGKYSLSCGRVRLFDSRNHALLIG